MSLTVKEMEVFIRRIQELIKREQVHLDWLYEKRIEVLNRMRKQDGCGTSRAIAHEAASGIEAMIKDTEHYLEFYQKRAQDYQRFVDQLMKA